MVPFLDQDHSSLRARVRQWAEKNLISRGRGEQQIDEAARRFVRQLGDEGFLACAVPKKFGGAREKSKPATYASCEKSWRAARRSLTRCLRCRLWAVIRLLFSARKNRSNVFFHRIAKGTAIAAFALTEPEAGSDVAALKSRAVRRDGEYVLTGNKRFISNAGIADSYVVFASTAPEIEGKGISAFVVDANNPGLIVKKRIQVISPHPIGMIAFEECVIPESSLTRKRGDGLKIALGDFGPLPLHGGGGSRGAGSTSIGRSCRLRPEAASVRSTADGVSGDSVQAGGNGDGVGSRATAGLSSGVGP